MKTMHVFKLTLALIAMVGASFTCYADDDDSIKLGERPGSGSPGRSILPVTASVNNSELNILFTSAVGDVDIMVVDEQANTVYIATVDSYQQSSLIVPVASWA